MSEWSSDCDSQVVSDESAASSHGEQQPGVASASSGASPSAPSKPSKSAQAERVSPFMGQETGSTRSYQTADSAEAESASSTNSKANLLKKKEHESSGGHGEGEVCTLHILSHLHILLSYLDLYNAYSTIQFVYVIIALRLRILITHLIMNLYMNIC